MHCHDILQLVIERVHIIAIYVNSVIVHVVIQTDDNTYQPYGHLTVSNMIKVTTYWKYLWDIIKISERMHSLEQVVLNLVKVKFIWSYCCQSKVTANDIDDKTK